MVRATTFAFALLTLGFSTTGADESPNLIGSVRDRRWLDPATWEGGRAVLREPGRRRIQGVAWIGAFAAFSFHIGIEAVRRSRTSGGFSFLSRWGVIRSRRRASVAASTAS